MNQIEGLTQDTKALVRERPAGWVTDNPEVRPKFPLNRAERRRLQKVLRRAAKRA